MVNGKPTLIRTQPDGSITDLAGQPVAGDIRPYVAPAVGPGGPSYSAPTLDLLVEQTFTAGGFPPNALGRSKQADALRTQIMNRLAELHPGANLALIKANYDANKKSLAAAQEKRDAITAFENTASANIDTFLETAGRVVDTKSPMANRVARLVSGSMLGSPNQAEYDAARLVAINEVAKVTGGSLSNVLTDSARKEVEAFNPREATLAQTVHVMRILKRDMAQRTKYYDRLLEEIRGRISPGAKPTGPSTPAGGPSSDPLGLFK
jgi:hypothetical protein